MRPSISPGLLAEITTAAPARLVKKLDATPTLAESWAWAGADANAPTVVTTDSGERVTLTPAEGTLSQAAQLACSCLLSPRCLHLLAVATLLPIANAAAAQAPGGDAPEPEPEPETAAPAEDTLALTTAQRAAVGLARRAAVRLLSDGAQGAGAVLRAEWLRAAHACKAESLPRLGQACQRVAQGLHGLQTSSAAFRLDDLLDDVGLALRLLYGLSGETAAASLLGSARRVYRNVGHLILTGLFTEPVSAETGARGVVTWLRDAQGRLYRHADIQPGDAQRARAAYDRGADIGDVSASHRVLARAGLLLQDATVSEDGRLGSGKKVRAVLAQPQRWSLDAPDPLFQKPLAAQIAALTKGAALSALSDDDDGAALVFFRAKILGAARDRLVLDAGLTEPVRARAALNAEALSHRDTLRVLAGAPGLELLCAARFVQRLVPEVELLAVGGTPHLPESWGGRCCIGLDRLQAHHLGLPQVDPNGQPGGVGTEPVGVGTEITLDDEGPEDPFDPLRRRLRRLLLGGRGVLTPASVDSALMEAARLDALLAPAAAARLRALYLADPEARPAAFAAAHRHLQLSVRALSRHAWAPRAISTAPDVAPILPA